MAPTTKLALSLVATTALIATAASAQLASEGGKRFVVQMTGEAEVPDGDLDGTGTAVITINRGQQRVCWDITVSGVDPLTAAHIHIGLEGQAFSGNIVVPFTNTTSGCTPVTNRSLLDAMIAAPQAFYVNVHNAAFPPGALRGQLG